jgi:hypothetical protein
MPVGAAPMSGEGIHMKSDTSSFKIDRDKLFAILGPGFSRGDRDSQPNPDEAPKPGPWDPLIRVAVKDLARLGPFPEPWHAGTSPFHWRFGPHPEPWITSIEDIIELIAKRFPAIYDVIGGGLNIGDKVALNPQPSPPRERFIVALGEALIDRAEQLAEVAGTFSDRGEEHGITAVGRFVNRLVDDWCGTGYRPKWPFPGPPPWWFITEVSGRDILRLGAIVNRGSEQAFDPVVRRVLADAADKLAEAGLGRLE